MFLLNFIITCNHKGGVFGQQAPGWNLPFHVCQLESTSLKCSILTKWNFLNWNNLKQKTVSVLTELSFVSRIRLILWFYENKLDSTTDWCEFVVCYLITDRVLNSPSLWKRFRKGCKYVDVVAKNGTLPLFLMRSLISWNTVLLRIPLKRGITQKGLFFKNNLKTPPTINIFQRERDSIRSMHLKTFFTAVYTFPIWTCTFAILKSINVDSRINFYHYYWTNR